MGYAHLRGLNLTGSHITSLEADGMDIDKDIYLYSGFSAQGEVSICGSTVGGDLLCQDSQFNDTNNGEFAFNVSSAKIGGTLFLNNSVMTGEVDLVNTAIGGNLECSGTHFINHGANALFATRLRIGGDAYFGTGFTSTNIFTLDGTATLKSAEIEHAFWWCKVKNPELTTLDLRLAKIGTLNDEEGSWPSSNKLFLQGLVYKIISDNSPTDVRSRIRWIHLQPQDHFWSQPYEQLATVLRDMGMADSSAEVMIEKNEDYAGRLPVWSLSRLWYDFIGKFAGYGYLPGRAFKWSIGFIILGTFIFWIGRRYNLILPSEEKDCGFDPVGTPHINENYPSFSIFVYSLEMFVPLVKLGMDDKWRPYANRRAIIHVFKIKMTIPGWLLRGYLWIHSSAGWVLTTLWVGGLTGLVKT